MMQITEDTPPDMLAGAMDLIIHLPNGRAVKMSVERSTPMMDLLVQITTTNQLQHSGHTLQALEMAPSSGKTDKILPYKPNTPIGALDTQHVKVVPKNRPVPAPRSVSVGHQPFESTFRLQVHLPRNQLYVIRVSQHVFLDDIMKKVCDEKNLDARKYEFRHPGNLDEVLDPKLTLSDYQITEVYIVSKGTVGLTQTFSSNDIMALKKEEERKQLQARTGGGVFSLIFKRGKPSMGSGSLSSDNRSISPSHSDDSRSVTPPAIQQQILPVSQQPPIGEKPKPPQRKRRPAPKPPQQARKESTENPPSQISTMSETNNSELQTKSENGLTICHSRNSSDSSGYHEPSVLSDNCNLSLPRRPKSNVIAEVLNEEIETTKSNSNLTTMSAFSKSTTSITSRKKKAAPPPPSAIISERIIENPKKASPVVASPIVELQGECETIHAEDEAGGSNRVTVENVEEEHAPSDCDVNSSISMVEELTEPDVENDVKTPPIPRARTKRGFSLPRPKSRLQPVELECPISQVRYNSATSQEDNTNDNSIEVLPETNHSDALLDNNNNNDSTQYTHINHNADTVESTNVEHKEKPQVVAVISKKTISSEFSRRKCRIDEQVLLHSKSASHIPSVTDTYDECELHVTSPCSFQYNISNAKTRYEEEFPLKSTSSVPNFMGASNIKRWSNLHDLDDISITPDFGGCKWVVGDDSDIDSLSTVPSKESPPDSIIQVKTSTPLGINPAPFCLDSVVRDQVDSFITDTKLPELAFQPPAPVETEQIAEINPVPAPSSFEDKVNTPEALKNEKFPELETEWQYQLPSPPTAFRDLSPTNLTEVTNYDTITLEGFKEESVITNPMLYEKLKLIKDSETDSVSDLVSIASEEERPMFNKLTLESLEKRKSLVYNRELSTSLKGNLNDAASKHSEVINEIEKVINGNGTKLLSRNNSCVTDLSPTLEKHIPNFKISTYDKLKTKINIFEDDSVRSNIDAPVKSEEEVPEKEIDLEKTPEDSCKQSIETVDNFKKPQEFNKLKIFSKSNFYVKHRSDAPKVISRSESFSSNSNHNTNFHLWKPQNPVQRSKSQVALNNYKEEKVANKETEALYKANSLFDVSGLQSLEVMRMIQTKLNTPSNSTEHLLEEEKPLQNAPKNTDNKESMVKEANESVSVKTYKYQGPPAINLSTWSERPKTKVSLKEDLDYRSNNIKHNGVARSYNQSTNINVSVKINGSEPIRTQESGNIVIKVGETHSNCYNSITRFSTNTSVVNYRKPFSNINKIDTGTRPHSIAYTNELDISRVPIVRSVELKKPFKDTFQMNKKSVTQINSDEFTNNVRNKFKDFQINGESDGSTNGLGQLQNLNDSTEPDVLKRTVHRVNSFAQNRFGPSVVGFKNVDHGNDNIARSRKSWNVPNNYGTLPSKINLESSSKTPSFEPNNDVPFSQAILRKVEVNMSAKEENNTVNQFGDVVLRNQSVENKISNFYRYSTPNIYAAESFKSQRPQTVPAPPPTPKTNGIKKNSLSALESDINPRDDLLNSIRNFGGVKGLKHRA